MCIVIAKKPQNALRDGIVCALRKQSYLFWISPHYFGDCSNNAFYTNVSQKHQMDSPTHTKL